MFANIYRVFDMTPSYRLPTLSREAQDLLTDCDKRIAALPAPLTSEPISFVLALVTAFHQDVKSYVDGQTFALSLVQRTRNMYNAFQKSIRETAPRFLPFEDQHSMPRSSEGLFKLDENDEQEAIYANLKLAGTSNLIFLEDVQARIIE